MFDSLFREVSDDAVISAIEECVRAEAAVAARRLAAVAELVQRRCGDDEHAHWSCDEWDFAATEVSAALGVSHGRASGQMYLAASLRHRLPRVAALFLAGSLSARVVSAIAWRTDLVQDAEALSLIDAAIAESAGRWDALSQYKLDQAIDVWVDRHDPGALRRTKVSAQNRDVTIGAQNHEAGTASLWGRLYATDAAALERRLTAMAHEVCEDDPRTIGQRRADALGTLGAGGAKLACQCGNPKCAAAVADARAASVVVHVLSDTAPAGAKPAPDSGSAVIVGGGVVPTPLLAELINNGAKVRHLRRPKDGPEPQYRPSTALDEFVRMRDLTCRFPNCDKPAEACDIDHAIPWPFGPTHPSSLRCLCRKHHLIKTFFGGEGGWRDRQSSDGTIVWTSPTGRTYTTYPGSRMLFSHWNTDTGAAPVPGAAPTRTGDRGLMMPTRRRTRAADRAYRIRRERALNDARVAERNRPPPF